MNREDFLYLFFQYRHQRKEVWKKKQTSVQQETDWWGASFFERKLFRYRGHFTIVNYSLSLERRRQANHQVHVREQTRNILNLEFVIVCICTRRALPPLTFYSFQLLAIFNVIMSRDLAPSHVCEGGKNSYQGLSRLSGIIFVSEAPRKRERDNNKNKTFHGHQLMEAKGGHVCV